MPSLSRAQHNAMAAAASGHSTLGIPASIGHDFITADRGRHFTAGGIIGFDDGGDVAGIVGQTAQSQNPITQSQQQRYAGMPKEKLQEMAVSLPASSQQGALVRQALQRKQMGMDSAPPSGADDVQKFAFGGQTSIGEGDPWWTRSAAHEDQSGLIHNSVPGRTDHVPMSAQAGSYVVPADVTSGLGEGNTLAGARVIDEMLSSGPWGTPVPRSGGGLRAPSPPAPEREARGGGVKRPVPILAAGGEYVLSPAQVRRIGGGNLKLGHSRLDAWIKYERNKHIKKLKSLPGPKKS